VPTRRGWFAFSAGIGLWIGARFAGSPDLHMVAVGVLAMPFLAAMFVQWNRLRLTIHRHLSSVRVFPGTRVVVTLTVENKGPGTAPFLLLEDSLPPSLGKPARVVVSGIPAGNSERVSYSVLCRQRGRFRLGPISVSVTDPFGLARVNIRVPDTNDLIVYPYVEDIPASELSLQGAGFGDSTMRQLYRSAAEFYTMREYVTGDDLRRIHWPSVARTGQLMIRQDEATRRSAATVFLDNRTLMLGSVGSQGFERAVSVAASMGRALLRAGFAVRLASVDAPAQPMAEERLLETLAGAIPTRERAFGGALAALRGSALAESTLVVVTAPPVGAEVEMLQQFGARFGRRVVVMVVPVRLEALPAEAAAELQGRIRTAVTMLRGSRWKVCVLPMGGRLAEEWKNSTIRRPLTVSPS
jgi:uncharacterized protein (DUF58 family)